MSFPHFCEPMRSRDDANALFNSSIHATLELSMCRLSMHLVCSAMDDMLTSRQRLFSVSCKMLILAFFAIIVFSVYFKCRQSPQISPTFINYDPENLRSAMSLPSLEWSSANKLIIHQSWKTSEVPKRMARWSLSWTKCFPNATYILWTDASNRELIRRYYPWYLYYYDTLRLNIQRADVARYFYLFHYGGLYVDLDTECLHPFQQLLNPYRIVFGSMAGGDKWHRAEGYVQNSLMYSKPRDPFWLDVIYRTLTISPILRPEDTTGPHVLMQAIDGYRERLLGQSYIKVYPPQFFNPNSWILRNSKHCKDLNSMSEEELTKCRKEFSERSFVLQYHTQTWGDGVIK